MSEPVPGALPDAPVHDHAWRRVDDDVALGLLYEYRCDICGLTWSV
jgi:hypothetical protein